MTGITNHAKKGDLENFCDSVGNFSTSVCGLTEAASQVWGKSQRSKFFCGLKNLSEIHPISFISTKKNCILLMFDKLRVYGKKKGNYRLNVKS